MPFYRVRGTYVPDKNTGSTLVANTGLCQTKREIPAMLLDLYVNEWLKNALFWSLHHSFLFAKPDISYSIPIAA